MCQQLLSTTVQGSALHKPPETDMAVGGEEVNGDSRSPGLAFKREVKDQTVNLLPLVLARHNSNHLH